MDNEYKVKELSKNWSKIMSYSIKFAKENKAKFNFIFKEKKFLETLIMKQKLIL